MIDTAGARRPRSRAARMRALAAHAALCVLAHAGRMRAGRLASALPRMCGRSSREVPRRLEQHQFGCEPVSAGQSAGGERSRRARARHDHQRGARAARGGRARGVRMRHARRVLAARRRAPQQRRVPGGGPLRAALLCARSPALACTRRHGGRYPLPCFLVACASIPAQHRTLVRAVLTMLQ